MPKKTDLLVDTSGWALYLDRTDPLYVATRRAIQAATASSRKLITTNYIIAELVACSPYATNAHVRKSS